jgi:protein-S-isoprenylcysteine O-methyltransferase Ste14
VIPQTVITDLLNRVDIVDIVGRYVQLKKGGANYMGLCPFHNAKSPSFTVSPTKQFYHCFGCGAHGTAIGFLIEYSGMGYAALGGAFCLVGVRAFQRARTTVNPITPAASTTLVVGRIYRMTRNPMYLGFALLLLALAMYLGKLSGFLLVPLFMVYLQHFQMLFALDHQPVT